MTENTSHLELRLVDLETRLYQQEKILSDLNDVIAGQWTKIDGLERQLRRLAEEVQSLDGDAGPAHQKPPHY
jgi:uncharacterized coiled-coil protein SlyX